MATGGYIYQSSRERTNYARLCRAIIDLCTQVLRDMLNSHTKPSILVQELSQNPQLRRLLQKRQYELVKNSLSQGYHEFDISTLYLCLRYLCPKFQAYTGWGQVSIQNISQLAQTDGDDIERIRLLRNYVLAHRKDTCIPDTEYNTYFQIIHDIMIRMDARLKTAYISQLQFIKTDCMDDELEKVYIEKVKDFEQSIEKLKHEVGHMLTETRFEREILLERQITLERRVLGLEETIEKKFRNVSNQSIKSCSSSNIHTVSSKTTHPIEYLDCDDFSLRLKGAMKKTDEVFPICGSKVKSSIDLQIKLRSIMSLSDLDFDKTAELSIDEVLIAISKRNQVAFSHLMSVCHLIQLGANVNKTDKDENTPLHSAVENQNFLLAILLIQYGADTFRTDKNNEGILTKSVNQHDAQCKDINIWNCSVPCDHAIFAKYFSYLMADLLEKSITSHRRYLQVWPGYKCQQKTTEFKGLCLVVQYEGITTDMTHRFNNIPIIWCDINVISSEGRYINFLTNKYAKNPETVENFTNFNAVDSRMASHLFKIHSKLNIISASMVKSIGYGSRHTVIEKPCVTLYCRVKGIIPIGEPEFKESLKGYTIDVREGYSSFCVSQHSTEKNDHLRMGCSVGTERYIKFGTLGGFIEKENSTYFITCAHALYSYRELQTGVYRYQREVLQPGGHTLSNKNKELVVGNVVKIRFPKTKDDSESSVDETSVDAALVKINSRFPENGNFPVDDKINIERAGYRELPKFTTGKILAEIDEEHIRDNVVKFGSKTGFTRGAFHPKGVHVRMEGADWLVTESDKSQETRHIVKIYNQYEILSIGNYPFAIPGDSGSFVFTVKDLSCVGMVVGDTSAGSILVTPISAILDSFALEKKLKVFLNSEDSSHNMSLNIGVTDTCDNSAIISVVGSGDETDTGTIRITPEIENLIEEKINMKREKENKLLMQRYNDMQNNERFYMLSICCLCILFAIAVMVLK